MLFDGEELLEDSNSKKDGKEEIKNSKEDLTHDDNTESKNELNTSTNSQTGASKSDLETPTISLSLKEEIDHALTKEDNKDDTEGISTPELPDNSAFNTELEVPTLLQLVNHVYLTEKACIVDLHHTKLNYKDEDKDVDEIEKDKTGMSMFEIIVKVKEEVF